MRIKTNSKDIKKNDIFICIHNSLEDRHSFIKEALKKKPACIIVDKNLNIKTKIPIIKVNNTNETFFQMLNYYYNYNNNKVKLIGITGTDGKTTTALMIKNLLNYFSKTAYLGTNGFHINDNVFNTKNTTPSLDKIFYYLDKTKSLNNNNLVIEASSEGLIRNRCYNLQFDYAVMTNITSDHLNVHKSINEYIKAKMILFMQVKKDGINILNIDDKYYKTVKKSTNKKVLTYGTNKKADYYFYNIKNNKNETIFYLKRKRKEYIIKSPFQGIFNVYNLVAAIALVDSMGYSFNQIINNIKHLKKIDGRLNYLEFNQNYKLIIDYAHTVNATYQVLNYLNTIKLNKIITVVGCAGERDYKKRPIIGKLVTSFSDFVFFTTDDPRYEDPNNIIKDMTKEIATKNYEVVIDRKKALYKALNTAKKDDIVIILGKGMDNYMAIKDKYIKYNDYEVIKNYFSLKSINAEKQ